MVYCWVSGMHSNLSQCQNIAGLFLASHDSLAVSSASTKLLRLYFVLMDINTRDWMCIRMSCLAQLVVVEMSALVGCIW